MFFQHAENGAILITKLDPSDGKPKRNVGQRSVSKRPPRSRTSPSEGKENVPPNPVNSEDKNHDVLQQFDPWAKLVSFSHDLGGKSGSSSQEVQSKPQDHMERR
eukprot:9030378-Karenia_brevis.AAC.1